VACHHHILELVFASIFCALFGPTGGPDVSLFKRFQRAWSIVDQKKFHVACNDMFDAYTSVVLTQMVKYYTTALLESHPREDYKELIHLCLIFLGGYEASAVSFRSPGAFHQTRWMAKAIYCLKLYLFQDQFTMTTKDRKGVTEMALFVSLVYTRFWHKAPRGISAPLNDVSRDRMYVRGHSARTCPRDTAVAPDSPALPSNHFASIATAPDLPARPNTPLWNRIVVRRHPATTSRP